MSRYLSEIDPWAALMCGERRDDYALAPDQRKPTAEPVVAEIADMIRCLGRFNQTLLLHSVTESGEVQLQEPPETMA